MAEEQARLVGRGGEEELAPLETWWGVESNFYDMLSNGLVGLLRMFLNKSLKLMLTILTSPAVFHVVTDRYRYNRLITHFIPSQ